MASGRATMEPVLTGSARKSRGSSVGAPLSPNAAGEDTEALRAERDALRLALHEIKQELQTKFGEFLGNRGMALLTVAGVDIAANVKDAPLLAVNSKAERDRLTALVLTLADSEHALNQQVSSLAAERDDLRERWSSSQQEMAQVAMALREAEEEMQRQLETARSSEKEALAKAEAATAAAALSRQQLSSKETELSELKQTLDDTRAQRDARLADLTTKLDAALQRAEDAEEVNRRSQSVLDLARLEAQAQQSALAAKVEAYRTEAASATEEASRLREDNASLRKEVEEVFRPQLEQCREELVCERAAFTSANREMVGLREDKDVLDDELRACKEQLRQAREEASDLETELAGARVRSEEALRKASSLEEQVFELQELAASQEADIEALKEELESTESALESAAARITTLQLQAQGLGETDSDDEADDEGDESERTAKPKLAPEVDGVVSTPARNAAGVDGTAPVNRAFLSPSALSSASIAAHANDILRSPRHASSFAASAALTIEHLQRKVMELEAKLHETSAVTKDTRISRASMAAAAAAAAAAANAAGASRFNLISPPGKMQQHTQRPARALRAAGDGARSFDPLGESEMDGDEPADAMAISASTTSSSQSAGFQRRATERSPQSASSSGSSAADLVGDDSHRPTSLLPWAPPESAHNLEQPSANTVSAASAASQLQQQQSQHQQDTTAALHQLVEEVDYLRGQLLAAHNELEAASQKVRESSIDARLARAENTRLTALVLRYKSAMAATASSSGANAPSEDGSHYAGEKEGEVAAASRLSLALAGAAFGGNSSSASSAVATAATFDASAVAATANAAAEAVEDLLQAQAERRHVAEDVEKLCRRAKSLQYLIQLVNRSLEAGHNRAEAVLLSLISRIRETEDQFGRGAVGKDSDAAVATLMAQLKQLQALQVAEVPLDDPAHNQRLKDAAEALADNDRVDSVMPGLPAIKLLASPLLSPLPSSSAKTASRTPATAGTPAAGIHAFSLEGAGDAKADGSIMSQVKLGEVPLPPDVEPALLLQRDGALSLAKRALAHVSTVASCAQALASVAVRHKASSSEVEGLLNALSSTVAAAEGDGKRALLLEEDGSVKPNGGSVRAAISTLQANLLEALGREQRRLEAAGELTERQLLVSQLAARVAECQSLTAGAMQVAEKLTAVSTALNAALVGKAAAEKKVEELSRAVTHAQKAAQQLTARAAAADAENRKKIATLEAERSSVEAAQQAQLRSLRTELVAVSEEKLTAQNALKQTREELQQARLGLSTQYQAILKDVDEWRAIFAPAGWPTPATPAEAANLVADLRHEAEFAKAAGVESAGARQQLLQQKEEISRLEADLRELRGELASAGEAYKLKDAEATKLAAQKADLEEQVSALQVQVGALGDKISELVDVARGLLERKTALKLEVSALKEELREAREAAANGGASGNDKRSGGGHTSSSPSASSPFSAASSVAGSVSPATRNRGVAERGAARSASPATATTAAASSSKADVAAPAAPKPPVGSKLPPAAPPLPRSSSSASSSRAVSKEAAHAEQSEQVHEEELGVEEEELEQEAPEDPVAAAVKRVLAMSTADILGSSSSAAPPAATKQATNSRPAPSTAARSASAPTPLATIPDDWSSGSSVLSSQHQQPQQQQANDRNSGGSGANVPSYLRPTASRRSMVQAAALERHQNAIAAATATHVNAQVVQTAMAAAAAAAMVEEAAGVGGVSPPSLLRAASRRALTGGAEGGASSSSSESKPSLLRQPSAQMLRAPSYRQISGDSPPPAAGSPLSSSPAQPPVPAGPSAHSSSDPGKKPYSPPSYSAKHGASRQQQQQQAPHPNDAIANELWAQLNTLLEAPSPDLRKVTGLPLQPASGPASGPAAMAARERAAGGRRGSYEFGVASETSSTYEGSVATVTENANLGVAGSSGGASGRRGSTGAAAGASVAPASAHPAPGGASNILRGGDALKARMIAAKKAGKAK